MQCLGTSLVFIMRNTKTSSDKNPTLEMIKSQLWWEAIKQLQRDRQTNLVNSVGVIHAEVKHYSDGQSLSVGEQQAPPGSTNDPENVHLAFLLELHTKTAGREREGSDYPALSDRLESFAQWSQMSRQTKVSASLPTTWKLGRFLHHTKHHKMLHISFSPKKYPVRSSLLLV